MNDIKMNAGVRVVGSFLGFDTALYMDTQKNIACQIELNNEGLTNFLQLFDEGTAKLLEEYVGPLGDFSMPILVWRDSEGGWTISSYYNKPESLRFIIHTGNNGRLLLFDYDMNNFYNLLNTQDPEIKGLLELLSVRKVLFCYLDGKPNGKELKKILKSAELEIPSRTETTAKNTILFYAKIDVGAMTWNEFKNSVDGIFKSTSLELFIEISTDLIISLVFPRVETSFMESDNLTISITLGSKICFEMSGTFALKGLNINFVMNAGFGKDDVHFSASSLPEQVYKIPGTNIVLSDMALAFGLAAMGLEFGMACGIAIRRLFFFGATYMTITEAGGTPVIELLSVALKELSISSLVENVLGIEDPALTTFNVIKIMPFELGYKERLVISENISKDDIAIFINQSGISKDFWVDAANIDVYTYTTGQNGMLLYSDGGSDLGLRVIDHKRMIHYNITPDGVLEFSPQFYFASKNVTMGAYNFPRGVFFCGELIFLGLSFKVMFCAAEESGIIGFAKIGAIDLGCFLKLTASEHSKQTENPVTTDPNSMIYKLIGNSSDDDAVLYVSLGKNNYSLYVDGHLELLGLFGLDTQLIFAAGYISIYGSFCIQGIFTVSIDFVVKYESLQGGEFSFKFIFDAEPLYEKLDNLRKKVEEKAKEWMKKSKSHIEKLQNCRYQVLSIQTQIDAFGSLIKESEKKMDDARWWQVWIYIEEGAKIVGYEAAIVSLNVAMGVALAALELAKAAVEAVEVLGEGIYATIDLVISGVMNAFFIRKLEFGIGVKDSAFNILGSVDLTVLGREISQPFRVHIEDIKNSLKDLLEKTLEDLVDSIFNSNTAELEDAGHPKPLKIDDDESYSHLIIDYDGPESLVKMVELAQEGATVVENGGKMVKQLNNEYIKEMCEERPEFVDMTCMYKEKIQDSVASIDRTGTDLYKAVKVLADEISKRVEKFNLEKDSSGEYSKICDALNDFRTYTEPAMVNVGEIRNRVYDTAQSIDPEEGKQMLRNMRMNMRASSDESEGIQIMRNRNYDRLYNKVEEVVEKHFPTGEHSNFFHFGNQTRFYEALNNSRKESGCAYYDERRLKEKLEKVRSEGGFVKGYRER